MIAFDLASLAAILRHPGATCELYQLGDMLALGDRVGEVIAANPRTLAMRFADGVEMLARDHADLCPAALEHW